MIDFKKLFGGNKDFIYPLGYELGDYGSLKNDGLGRELAVSIADMFSGTPVVLDTTGIGAGEEIRNLSMLNRMALTSALFYGGGYHEVMQPIAPLDSEYLLERGKFVAGSKEALALLLYDVNGSNEEEANVLLDSIKANQEELGLSDDDLSKRLVVINAGLEKDTTMPYSVKLVVLPGYTEVYSHETLDFSDNNYKFDDGFDRGLPHSADLGHGGGRTLKMPGRDSDIGLRVLVREGRDVLNASYESLIQNEPDARMYIGPRPKQA